MKKIITLLVLVALLATLVWACGCAEEKSMDRKDGTTTTQTTGEELEPGPRYDPYVPAEGELVTPSDWDLGLQEGYEAGYWVGLVDGMRGVYDADPVEYDDSNEYYVEGFLEGYQEGYDDGYSDGEEA